jgi:pimeloyl-ACP methyl ester carboxylesterase
MAVATLLLVFLASLAPAASAQALKPFKDELFAYPGVLQAEADGTYTVVAYDKMRDIHARDQVPERRVKGKYISTGVRRQQNDLVLRTAAGDVRHYAVGRTSGARFIVVYLHGKGGSRRQGVDDFTFGGNFNRIKNLAAQNGGLYLSPDFPDFKEAGAARIAALIDHYANASPGAKVYVACGSMGGGICWLLANDAAIAPRLGGLFLLGSYWDESFLASAAYERKVPIYFGHGSDDTVFPVDRQEAFFRQIRAKSPGYPARFVRFDTGSHGTPIRMTDWRETLNWMMSANP